MNRFAWIAATVSLVVSASAQSNPEQFIPRGVSLRVGTSYFFEDATRDVTGQTFNLGFDFSSGFSLVKRSEGYFSIDVIRKGLNGGRPTIIPIMWNQKFELNAEAENPTYFFVGVGAVNVDVFRSKYVLGVRGGLGYNINSNTFAEASVLWSEEARGARANSFNFSVGYRF